MNPLDILEWCEEKDHAFRGYVSGCVLVGKVVHADEGEAEGGLMYLARFMTGAFHPEVQQPPLSPAGWYWTATTEERGRWEKAGPFASPEEARDACTEAFRVGKYLAEEYAYRGSA